MSKITKEFPSEHYLENDIVVEFDTVSGTLAIASYVKNTGRRRFEMVGLNSDQVKLLKNMLNEVF